MEASRLRHILKNKKQLCLICAALGIIFIGASFLSVKNKSDNAESLKLNNNEIGMLESRLEEILKHATGDGSVNVMITTSKETKESKYASVSEGLFSGYENTKTQKATDEIEIAGVMIVCKSINNANDLSTIKQASATALGIDNSKIYIIGGNGEK